MSRCFRYLFFHQCFRIMLISNLWNLDHALEMPSYLHLPHLLRPPKGITDHRNTKPFKRSKLEGNQILKYHEYTTKIRKVKVKHTLKNINMTKYVRDVNTCAQNWNLNIVKRSEMWHSQQKSWFEKLFQMRSVRITKSRNFIKLVLVQFSTLFFTTQANFRTPNSGSAHALANIMPIRCN